MAALHKSRIAFVAGEWTLTGVRVLVRSESVARYTPMIAFIASEWTLAGMNAQVRSESAV
jgi:hypothetical protein